MIPQYGQSGRFLKNNLAFTEYLRISSYKALPWIIPAFLIRPTPGTLLCRWNLVIFNNTHSWKHYKQITPAGLIWGYTVGVYICNTVYIPGHFGMSHGFSSSYFSQNLSFLGQVFPAFTAALHVLSLYCVALTLHPLPPSGPLHL